MGSNKAELEYHSMRLIDYQVNKLAAIGISDIMVSGYSEPVAHTRFVADFYEGKGPLSGIHAGLIHSKYTSCLVIGVDIPLIPSYLIKGLLESHGCHDFPVTITSHQGHLEPLIGVYDCSLALLAEQVLLSTRTSVHSLLEQTPFNLFSCTEDESVFLNCNTSEEYERLLNTKEI